MKNYRIYVLNAGERVAETTEALFPDDREALAAAETARADQFAAEVWIEDRLVGRLGQEFRL